MRIMIITDLTMIIIQRPVAEAFEPHVADQEKAAQQGDADAQYHLGAMYKYGGYAVEQDSEKADEWHAKAATAGTCMTSAVSLTSRALASAREWCGQTMALHWLEKSAKQGHKTQYHLAGMYHEGLGVKPSYDKAFPLYEAVKQGEAEEHPEEWWEWLFKISVSVPRSHGVLPEL